MRINLAPFIALYVATPTAFASAASAEIVWNQRGDCWHTELPYQPKREYNVIIHSNGWIWTEGENYRWREHEGHGYWDGDKWREF